MRERQSGREGEKKERDERGEIERKREKKREIEGRERLIVMYYLLVV